MLEKWQVALVREWKRRTWSNSREAEDEMLPRSARRYRCLQLSWMFLWMSCSSYLRTIPFFSLLPSYFHAHDYNYCSGLRSNTCLLVNSTYWPISLSLSLKCFIYMYIPHKYIHSSTQPFRLESTQVETRVWEEVEVQLLGKLHLFSIIVVRILNSPRELAWLSSAYVNIRQDLSGWNQVTSKQTHYAASHTKNAYMGTPYMAQQKIYCYTRSPTVCIPKNSEGNYYIGTISSFESKRSTTVSGSWLDSSGVTCFEALLIAPASLSTWSVLTRSAVTMP